MLFELSQKEYAVGKHDPERQLAIATQLSEMGTSVTELIHDAIRRSDSEDSREIEEDYYLHRRARIILEQLRQLGMSPSQWASGQPYSLETSQLHSMLDEMLERQ